MTVSPAPVTTLSVVVVTRNHERTIASTLRSIAGQTQPADQVIVIDCGSFSTSWAEGWMSEPRFEIILLKRNIGFTGANNLGWRRVKAGTDLVVFLNPDVLVPPDLFARLTAVMGESRTSAFAAIGPRLVQWDFALDRGTGRIDSTGIFPGNWGGWSDRRDGSPPVADVVEPVPALCGAFFLARTRALRAVELTDGSLWDERYFAYKEDIELSLRLRRSGWQVGVWHGGEAGHGRGWKSRREMPRHLRVLSARNEIRLHATYARGRLPASVLKWIAACILNL